MASLRLDDDELVQLAHALAPHLLAVLRDREEDRGPPPRLLSRLELAEVLGVSVASIDRLGKDGLPCVRVGSHRRFDLGDVRAWLGQRDEGDE